MRGIAAIASAAVTLAGCAPERPHAAAAEAVGRAAPDYRGVETRLLDLDLLSVDVAMGGAASLEEIEGYARCAAALDTLSRARKFLRHLRTNVAKEGGLWRADAVYTISARRPEGLRTIDAEVEAAACAERGIPMV
ncbi:MULTISPECIES: hypothetical protein [unclassified Rhodosalinus]|uniref:hypothetical protein n=1 Tax=unclassified Rhodosalinus TaxID=2630183 RepID=UPI00352690B4